MDNELHYFADRRGIDYTRYADDLSFSPHKGCKGKSLGGHDLLVESHGFVVKRLKPELDDIFAKHGQKIQPKKTRLWVRHWKSSVRMEVTGLVVSKFPNVARREIRWIRSILDLWETRGYQFAIEKFQSRKSRKGKVNRHLDCPKELSHVIMGKLLFLSSIRGTGDYQFLKLRRKFLILCSNLSAELAVEMRKALGKVSLDDFARRPNYHLNEMRNLFEHAEPPKLTETELGSWAYDDYQLWANLRKKFSKFLIMTVELAFKILHSKE